MKIQLSKYFQKIESPYKLYMDKQKQQQKQINERRYSLKTKTKNSIQIIDPLNEQMHQYGDTFDKTKVYSKSKAFGKMKRYLNQQDRKLKHVRLQQIKFSTDSKVDHLSVSSPIQNQSLQFITALPQMDEFFKNQFRDTMLYQNSIINQTINNRLDSLNDTIQAMSCSKKRSVSTYDNKPEIDRTIAIHKEKNRRLIANFTKQKQEIKSGTGRHNRFISQPLLITSKSKPIQRTKIKLQGLKSVSIVKDDELRHVSPSVALLLQMKSLNQMKLKKQAQLDALLRHEHQNRQQHYLDKSCYYSDSVQLKTLSPSVQFNMRKVMNHKLLHRLKASKDQALNFNEFMIHLKQSRTIICPSLQQIFQIIRSSILAGKTLRQSDFDDLLKRYDKRQELRLAHNVSIIKKVKNMMV